ncbi:MAG: hypothetical protein WDW36_007591 [Sanguina aurantia]
MTFAKSDLPAVTFNFQWHTGKWMSGPDFTASTSLSYDSQHRRGRVQQSVDLGKRCSVKAAFQHTAQKALEAHPSLTAEGSATLHFEQSSVLKSVTLMHQQKEGLSCSIMTHPTERLHLKSTYALKSQTLKSSISFQPLDKKGATVTLDAKLDPKKRLMPSVVMSLSYAV